MPGAFAPSLVADAVRLGTWVPFNRIPALLHGFVGTWLSEPTVRRLTEVAGAAYVDVQAAAVAHLEHLEQSAEASLAPPVGPAVLQVSVDGAMVPLRGKGEWAEVKTLALGRVAATADGPTTVELSYFSRRADHETFTRLATVETHRRGVETAGTVCGVVDGAEWCQQFFDVHRPDAVRILDFSHAAGYLAQIGQAAFGPGTAAAATWYEAQRHALKHDPTPDGVLAAVRAVRNEVATRPAGAAGPAGATTVAAPVAALDTVTKSLTYLEKRRDHLQYAAFQQRGYPIGSGIVESANKLVVEARLKGAGMHWAPAHVDPMVALRTVVCADRWDEAWPQICAHLRQQLRQHHRTAAAQRRAARLAHSRASLATPPTSCTPPPTPPPAPPPHAPLSYGPGRPAPDHPWKRARFLLPSRRTLATAGDAKL